MGGSAPSKEHDATMDEVKEATTVQEINHPVFGKMSVCNCQFKNGQKGLAYKRDVLIESPGVAQKLLAYSKRKDGELKDHFLAVYGYSIENYSAMCGNNTVVNTYFEPFKVSLQNIIAQRLTKQEGPLPEKEGAEIINSLCRALLLLEKDKVKHGNISPESIFLVERKYKTYHPEVLKPVVGDNLNKFLSKKTHYSSPEQLAGFKKQTKKPPLNPVNGIDSTMADIYSLGLVMLELCTLQQDPSYFNSDLSVNKGLIQEKLTDMSNHYSNEFMEMVIRMLTIDPVNRISAEELIQLTSLQPGEVAPMVNEPALVSEENAILAHPVHVLASKSEPNHNIVGQRGARSDSRDVPQFGYPIEAGNSNQRYYGTPFVQEMTGSLKQGISNPGQASVSANQIQFKQTGINASRENLPLAHDSKHVNSQSGANNESRGLQRSVSRGNFFDPELLNRVNTARDLSRLPNTARDVSPIPTSQINNSQRINNLEGSAISSSRIKRKDLSKSPLKKIYGSRLEEDDRSKSRPPNAQSTQNIAIRESQNNGQVDSGTQSSRILPQAPFNQSERVLGQNHQNLAMNSNSTRYQISPQSNLHQSNQILNPLQMKYPLSSNRDLNLNFFKQANTTSNEAAVDKTGQYGDKMKQQEGQFAFKHTPEAQTSGGFSQRGVISRQENKLPPMPTTYGRVTRYSVDKNGQRHLIHDSQTQPTREQPVQGSMPNIMGSNLGWNTNQSNQVYGSTTNLGSNYGRVQPSYPSQQYQHSVGITKSAIGQYQPAGNEEIQRYSQNSTTNRAPEETLIRNNSVTRIVSANSQANLPPKPAIQQSTLARVPSQTSINSQHTGQVLINSGSNTSFAPYRQSNSHQNHVQIRAENSAGQTRDSQNQSQSGISSQITPANNTRDEGRDKVEREVAPNSYRQEIPANNDASSQQRLIEKLYVKDNSGNTVELKTYLCSDGSTKTERRIAINSKGELHGKFKETGVDLSDVIQADKDEIARLIQENAIKIATHNAQMSHKSPVKGNLNNQISQPASSDKKSHGSNQEPLEQFRSFNQQQIEILKQPVSVSENLRDENTSPNHLSTKKSVMLGDQQEKPSPLSDRKMNEQVRSPVPDQLMSEKRASNVNSGQKSQSSPQKAKVSVPPGLANSIKGKTVKVRYKEYQGKTYPVGISGPDLTREEKDWLLKRIIQKEGYTIEEIEDIEGGYLVDADNGSEYRLTEDQDLTHRDSADGASHMYKNERASNLVKDIQNQVINEQDEEVVSQSSAYPSQRKVATLAAKDNHIEKFDLMHQPTQHASNRDDEIWFRTKEQKVLDENDHYRNIDMSKSSRKAPNMVSALERQAISINNVGPEDLEDYISEPKTTNTKFNYGTNHHYNAGILDHYESDSVNKNGSPMKENDHGSDYDPSDIDELLKHNENLLSKIKIDMRNIGESFVSHTDMGSSRVGLKNNLSSMHRHTDFDSKDMINRSPIGIQEFESFKTKTHEKSHVQYKHGHEDNSPMYENHRMRVDEIWEKTMNSSAKRRQMPA